MQDLPADRNAITLHAFYKIAVNDNTSLKLEARIALQDNEDFMRNNLRIDCSMCPATAIWIIASVASLYRWKLSKTDATLAILQTGSTARNVYVLPPKKSPSRGNYAWILLTAAYGLCDANAKSLVQSDDRLHQIGFISVPLIPQCFGLPKRDMLIAIACNVVDGFLPAGTPAVVEPIIRKTNNCLKLGTALYDPGQLRFFRIILLSNMTILLQMMQMAN